MWIFKVFVIFCVFLISSLQAKIGYFWHITDFHYDPLYSSEGDNRRYCHWSNDRGSSGHHRSQGRLGDYACDSPYALVESATRYMRTRHPENVEFVLWTGDIVSSLYTTNEDERYRAIENITDLLRGTFTSHFVFPALGHLDPGPSERLTNLWMKWLPLEALQTFQNGGYYTIEQKQSKLRIMVLNTNLFGARRAQARAQAQAQAQTGSARAAAAEQWLWLEDTLNKAEQNKEMVYIVGHAAPGPAARSQFDGYYSSDATARYLDMVRRHSRIIAGQFFGHLHSDTFRVFYDNDRPVSWALLAPSVTPHREEGSTNPSLRLYKFDINTGKVLHYTQFYLDLAASNHAGKAEWLPAYNLTQYYGLYDVSALALHNLAEKLRSGVPHDSATFNKYIRAYSGKRDAADACDGACAQQHYCSITCLDRISYQQCVEAAASALAAAGNSAALAESLTVIVYVPLIIALVK